MSEWNDSKSFSMSFDLNTDEATLDFFKREMKELEDFEKAINARMKQLFDEYVCIDGKKEGEAYKQVLKVFAIGYQLGWNDQYSINTKGGKEL